MEKRKPVDIAFFCYEKYFSLKGDFEAMFFQKLLDEGYSLEDLGSKEMVERFTTEFYSFINKKYPEGFIIRNVSVVNKRNKNYEGTKFGSRTYILRLRTYDDFEFEVYCHFSKLLPIEKNIKFDFLVRFTESSDSIMYEVENMFYAMDWDIDKEDEEKIHVELI